AASATAVFTPRQVAPATGPAVRATLARISAARFATGREPGGTCPAARRTPVPERAAWRLALRFPPAVQPTIPSGRPGAASAHDVAGRFAHRGRQALAS